MMSTLRSIAAALALASTGVATLGAQELPVVEPGFEAGAWLAADAAITLHLSAPLAPDAGALALFIGGTDVTALTEIDRVGLRYRPVVMPLPSGETDIVVYHIDPGGEWRELSRVGIRVLTPHGFREARLDPRLDISNEGQLAEGQSPAEAAAGRGTYQYGTVNTGIETVHARGGLILSTRVNAVGVTERERALRFGERQGRASRYDLADYLLTARAPGLQLSAGNVAFGASRHLLNSYSTRGLSASAQLGRGAEFGLAAMAGRSIVGWQRLAGIGEPGSRILSATLGIEAVPGRPGLLRVEGTVMDGEVRASPGFTQGAVTDVESNRGGAVRLIASDPSQRVSLEAGFARSRFRSPSDDLLSRGIELVPVRPTANNARYVDAGVHLLRGSPLAGLPANLHLAFRHERVDPLYRSVAVYAPADTEQNALEATASVGPVSIQVGHGRGRDNLDRIESILETLTRDTRAGLSVPMAALLGATTALLPEFAYSYSRVHQFGAGVPPNSGFEPGHVPDQVSDNHVARLGWQFGMFAIGYQFDTSIQDNRQPGRENADFNARNHSATVALMSWRSISLHLDGALERAESRESGEITRGRRAGASLDLRATATTALSVQGSVSRSREAVTGMTQSATTAQAQLSQRITMLRRRGSATRGQLFIRFSGSRAEASGFDLPLFRRTNWSINTGANLSVF
ncbi:MAG TPA: hypothetical protein VK936_10005 [Longimicrobiales bacterium]|nr:hypothetical protein [Longimicrobiales bacterium]